MARVHECKATAEVSRRLVVRICPVTGGRPTKMTEATFMRLCAANRKTEAATEFGHQYHVSCAFCAICKGNQRPKELTIISLEEMAGMVVEKKTNHEVEQMRKQTKCDGCGKSKALSMCSGELLCSSCAALAGAVSNRPEIVARMIAKRGKTADILVALDVGQAAVEVVESDVLEEIASMLGFPDSAPAILGAELLARLKEKLQQVETIAVYQEERDRHAAFIAQLREILGQETGPVGDLLTVVRSLKAHNSNERDELISAQNALGEICRVVEVGKDGSLTYAQIVLAVAHTAGLLEETRRQLAVADADLMQQSAIFSEIHGVLEHDGPAADLPDQVRLVVAELGSRAKDGKDLAGDVDDLRAQKNDFQAVLDSIAELANAESYAPADVIKAVAHTEAIVEDLMRVADDLAQVPADLPLLLSVQSSELHNVRINLQAKQDQIGLLADQLSEAEQRLLADEQVFSRVREVIGDDGCANGDIPTAISSLIYASETLPANRQGVAERLDARLLGLLLDHPEIGLERIAEIREVV
jgi:hypothetical protein